MISTCLRGLSRRRLFTAAALLLSLASLLLVLRPVEEARDRLRVIPAKGKPVRAMPLATPLPPLPARLPCRGPRGHLLSESPDDNLREKAWDEQGHEYPFPWAGSHELLGLPQTWMTVNERWGPYGYGESGISSKRAKVEWEDVDWADLQNKCFQRNVQRFGPAARPFSNEPRFSFFQSSPFASAPTPQWHEFNNSRRTAVVVRAFQGYEYQDEDLFYLRSLIVEAGLRTGGEYTIILLVDVHDPGLDIFSSREAYWDAFNTLQLPLELESIAILWDENLLRSWYPGILEYRAMWQVYQPMQLLALHYPEFDHFWQLELDVRFTGDAGRFLDALDAFARAEPRKQALERATFIYMPHQAGSYAAFSAAVNAANGGGTNIWGPWRIPDISPIGPEPPVRDPRSDNFAWGVGEDADVIVTSFCFEVARAHDWIFKNWIYGFERGTDTPRVSCPPAVTRTSRTLLLAQHEAQLRIHVRLPSEATPSSFALWHGLKLSYPPMPLYWQSRQDSEFEERWWKGGPANSSTGLGPDDIRYPSGDGLSFWWESAWPRKVVDAWAFPERPLGAEFPWVLRQSSGRNKEVYAPNMMLHPVKKWTPQAAGGVG